MYKLNSVTWFNEEKEHINSLSHGSSKMVKKICPYCKKESFVRFSHISECQHTFCRGCSRANKIIQGIMGKRFGRLEVLSASEPIVSKKGVRHSAVSCRCDCGRVIIARTSYLISGAVISCGCRIRETGEKSPTWNPNLSQEERERNKKHRGGSQIDNWKKNIKKRDNFTCQVCGEIDGLVVHHIESYTKREDLRFDIDNGICLCKLCHDNYHLNFLGNYRKVATRKSFEEWRLCRLQSF